MSPEKSNSTLIAVAVIVLLAVAIFIFSRNNKQEVVVETPAPVVTTPVVPGAEVKPLSETTTTTVETVESE